MDLFKMDNAKLYYDEMASYVNIQHNHVKENINIQVVSKKFPYMLHISTNKNIKTFIPRIGERQASSEDRTIPRLCVADTLLGTMIGYAAMLNDFRFHANSIKKKKSIFKGGYYIYKIPYEACLVPNNKLVYDASASGERWLVNYKKSTSEYKGELIGKIFIKKIEELMVNNKTEISCIMFLEITQPLYFTSDTLLNIGYYKISGVIPDMMKSYKKNYYKIEQINYEEYAKIKKLSVSLLNYDNYHNDKKTKSRLFDWIKKNNQ